MKKIPVIPAKHWFFRNSLEVLKDPLKFFIETFEQYGDIYDVNANFIKIYVLANPDYIQEVMVTNKTDYAKSDDYKVLKHSLGNGLLTSEGEFWKKQRRIAQPAFHRKSMKKLLDTMITSTQAMVDKWSSRNELQITDEMQFITLDIVTKCLFGSALKPNLYEKIHEAVTVGNEFLSSKIMNPFTLPVWFPTAASRHYKKTRDFNNKVILDIINTRANDPTEYHDLLSMLMNAEDEETGEKMSPQPLLDEALTIFVAGHETTANALSWTFYLLSQHPDKLQKLQQELQEVLQGEAPSFETLRGLEYTQMVLEESMRLYPPAWSIGRKVVQDTELCGHALPKGAGLILDVYTMHRHPNFWDNPHTFEPERFHPSQKKGRHKYAFIPFGAGQRMCIGNNFAMMEMKIILAMVFQKFSLTLSPNAPIVEPEPLVTLRPKNGILMDINALVEA